MKTLVVILTITATISADIGIGYHYKTPQSSYQTPSYGSSGANSGFSSGSSGQSSGYKEQTYNSGSNSYQTSNTGLQNGFQSPGFQNTGARYPTSGYQSGSGYQLGSGFPSGSGYQSGSGHQIGSGYQSGSGHQTGSGYQSGSGHQTGSGYQSGAVYQTGSGLQYGGNRFGTGYQKETGYQSGNYQSGSGNQYQTSGQSGSFSGSSHTGAPAQTGYQDSNKYQTSSQYHSNSANYQQYYDQVQHQPAQIFKHFYVHAAPEEPEPARPRQHLVLPAPQKHYKIIFIKTPAPPVSSAQLIPVQQQNEEKTIVYVLVKKPEEAEDIAVPKLDQKPPSKPEVYFIKYKGKEDSQAVINNIVNEYHSGKDNVNIGSSVHSTGTLEGIQDVNNYVTHSGSSSSQTINREGHSGNQGSSGSFGSQSYETSGYQVSTAAPVQVSTVSGGYDSGFSSTVASPSVAEGFSQESVISTSQGIPHETYGPPKFKEY